MNRYAESEPEVKAVVPPDHRPLASRPSDALIEEELARVLSSRTFHAAEGQSKFLQYAVKNTVSGQSRVVKEYTIGAEVFGRGPSFDPRLDNIVRAEARKLRSRLAKYYAGEGQDNPIRIEFPSRGYVPTFREADAALPGALADTSQKAAPTRDSVTGTEDPQAVARVAHPAEKKAESIPHSVPAPSDRRWPKPALAGIGLVLAVVGLYAARSEWAVRKTFDDSPSIAVLPFHNLGDNKDESFSDGLTDDLIDSLGRVQGLHVVARTSAFQFRNTTLDIRDVAEKLNVRTVLEGSVRIYGNRIRVTAALDDSTNGYRVWSDSYEQDFKDALLLQRDISQAIVTALSAEFAKNGSPIQLRFSPGKAVSVNADAYQDYLKGAYFWNKQTAESINTAIGYFNQAIAKDPKYAPAYTGLARCYVNMPAFTMTRAREVVPKIRELAMKALELDSSLAEPHMDLAYASFLSHDWAGAEAEFKKGLALRPGDAVAHRWYAVYLSNVGRLNESLTQSEIAQQLDPVSPYMLDGLARNLYLMRRYDEAIEQFKKALALESRHGHAHLGLGMTYLQKHMYSDAIVELQVACQQMKNSPSSPAGLAAAYAASGEPEKARAILRQFLEKSAHGDFPPKPIADVYLSLGDKDKAFEWLGKAFDAQDSNLYIRTDPFYDPLRKDPRFDQLFRRAKVPGL